MNKNIIKYKQELEKERDIDIFISKTRLGYKVKIEKIIWWKLFEVWTIESSNYKDWLFSTNSHLAHWVENDFKWEWYGQLLYDIFKYLVFNTSDAIIPEKEYVSKPSRLLFLIKNWYKIESKITQDKHKVTFSLLSDSQIDDIIKTSKDLIKRQKENSDFLEKNFKCTYELVLVDEEILNYY